MQGVNITQIEAIDWQGVPDKMHDKGYVTLPGILSDAQCQTLIDMCDHPQGYSKAVVMARYREVHSGNRYTLGIIFHDAVS